MENEESKNLGADINRILNEKKGEHLDQVIKKAVADEMILTEILKGLKSKDETFRYNCFKVFFQISKAQPLLLYPEWEYFLDLLSSPNSYHRMSAINILSNQKSLRELLEKKEFLILWRNKWIATVQRLEKLLKSF